jgi:hypothetical protein
MLQRGSAGRKVNFQFSDSESERERARVSHTERSQHTNAFRPRCVPSEMRSQHAVSWLKAFQWTLKFLFSLTSAGSN